MASVTLNGTTATTSGGGTDWTNKPGAYGTDSTNPAQVSVSLSGASKIMSVAGMSANQVPVGSVLTGLAYGVTMKADLTGASVNSSGVGVSINGKTDSTQANAAIGTGYSGYSAGGPSTIPSGLSSVSVADINTGDIDVTFGVIGAMAGIESVSAYDASLKVYYNPPGSDPDELMAERGTMMSMP